MVVLARIRENGISNMSSSLVCYIHLDNLEFKTVEKVMGNHSTIFPKKSWQFTDNREKETMENHDHLFFIAKYKRGAQESI